MDIIMTLRNIGEVVDRTKPALAYLLISDILTLLLEDSELSAPDILNTLYDTSEGIRYLYDLSNYWETEEEVQEDILTFIENIIANFRYPHGISHYVTVGYKDLARSEIQSVRMVDNNTVLMSF